MSDRELVKNIQTESLEENFLLSFVIQYYMENVIPNLILLSSEFQKAIDLSILEKALYHLSEKNITVRTARGKGEKELIKMALQNSALQFEEQYLKQESLFNGLKDIQKKFRLKAIPERIECFDISHFQGSDTVASQVVFENGEPKKEDYRRYKIKRVASIDDFAFFK